MINFKFGTKLNKPGTMILIISLLLMFMATVVSGEGNDNSNSKYQVVAYLPTWRDWDAKKLAIDKLTQINLSFCKVLFGVLAEGADFKGLNALIKLKETHPNLKVVVSVGGWNSDGFSDAAFTVKSREKFADSVVKYLHKNKVDGIDIDWEFPVGGGLGKVRPEDKQNFTLLMQALRSKLDEAGKQDGKTYLLSFAANVNPWYVNQVELDKLAGIVDYINLMTYDFHGSWENKTGFHTNLYSSPDDVTGLSMDDGVKRYLTAGVPAQKIIVGAAFYGHGWSGVNNENNGRYQPASGGCSDYSYTDLVRSCINKNGFIRYWDDTAKAPYLWNGKRFITYDDEESIGYKVKYLKEKGLGGIMFWEYTQDESGTLLNRINEVIKQN